MNCSVERLQQRLQAELGRDVVAVGSDVRAAHVIDGHIPELVCLPTHSAQVAAVLRICAEMEATIAVWGGGTAVSVGNIPGTLCVVLDLRGLNRVIDHDHANLTITVESGATLQSLQDVLSHRRQFVPIDAPHPARATIGGSVAVDINGPRRGYYGGIRDLVIGMKATLMIGEQIKAGGKVVKNVAGYDMCKLFTGSLGTLAVMTEITVRVVPTPETTGTLVTFGSFSDLNQFGARLLRIPLFPSSVILGNTLSHDSADDSWQCALRCEGFEEAVKRQLIDARAAAQQMALRTEDLQDADHEALWKRIRDFPLEFEHVTVRASVPRTAAKNFIEAAKQTVNPAPAIIADLMIGTVWLSWPAAEVTADVWPNVLSLASAHSGHAVMFSAPRRLKEGVDVWGPAPSSLPLMRALKQQFDPDGLLNPGRFLAGI
jgi:glycolate oxidase FAD binding subunit